MKIHMHDVRLHVSLGIHPWEQDTLREVQLNLTLEFNGQHAAATDDIAQTIDYSAVEESLRILLASRHWSLIETLVEAALDKLMQQFPLIENAELKITKPGALRFAPAVAVSSTRTR